MVESVSPRLNSLVGCANGKNSVQNLWVSGSSIHVKGTVVADLFIKIGAFDWVVGVRYGVWHPNLVM